SGCRRSAAVPGTKIKDGQKGLIAPHHQIGVLGLKQFAATALDADLALRPVDPAKARIGLHQFDKSKGESLKAGKRLPIAI
ncbi:hypothetical protein, partial [Serratia marcescens]|uniref:hypothetical protein n=1 Tax=Serratia marcescens TaxID=615 RepID=UPI0013D9357F